MKGYRTFSDIYDKTPQYVPWVLTSDTKGRPLKARNTIKPSAPSADISAASFSRCSAKNALIGSIPDRNQNLYQIPSSNFQRGVQSRRFRLDQSTSEIRRSAEADRAKAEVDVRMSNNRGIAMVTGSDLNRRDVATSGRGKI